MDKECKPFPVLAKPDWHAAVLMTSLHVPLKTRKSHSYDKLRIWTVEDGRIVLDIPVSANDMAIDTDDRWIAFACSSPFSVVIYDLKAHRRIHEIPHAHSESLTSVDYSPDGKRIVSAAFDGKIKTWDWVNGTMVFATDVGKVHGAYAPVVQSAQYSKDGKLIVTASSDNVIRIWNAASGEQQGKPLAGHVDSVRARLAMTEVASFPNRWTARPEFGI